MIDFIYVEEEIANEDKTSQILQKYPNAKVIHCASYREVFNRKGQNFRLQKIKPSLILAKKYGDLLHPIPDSFSIGAKHNYYFSHFLNCPYDCNYCYLQGMFRSANFVFFTNFSDFKQSIINKVEQFEEESITFYSGYDGDSLAMESTTQFCDEFLPLFEGLPNTAELEIRTKSPIIAPFTHRDPVENVIIAYTLNPDKVAKKFETGAPSLRARVSAMKKLAKLGWKIGLRFDPVIDVIGFEEIYASFFEEIFSDLPLEMIHSVTLGAFRLPPAMRKQMSKLSRGDGLIGSLQREEVIPYCFDQITKYINKEKVFVCQDVSSSQALVQVSGRR